MRPAPERLKFLRAVVGLSEEDRDELFAEIDAMTADRDESQGALASLADAINTWLREIGREMHQAYAFNDLDGVRRALDEIGFEVNRGRQERDKAQARTDRMEVAWREMRAVLVEVAGGSIDSAKIARALCDPSAGYVWSPSPEDLQRGRGEG